MNGRRGRRSHKLPPPFGPGRGNYECSTTAPDCVGVGMVRKASTNVIGVELGLLEEGGDVVIVDSVLDLVVVPPD